MATNYKLTYFDLMALAEPIRYLLAFGGIDYEDVRLQREDWPALKSSTPYERIPVFVVDGKTAHQSIAICRYLSRKVGLAGVDDWQNLKIDSTVDTVVDLRSEMVIMHLAKGDEKSKLKEKFENQTIPFYFGRLDTQVKENGGFLVDKKLTWADLHFTSFIDMANGILQVDVVEKYPNLKALVEKICNLPKIKAWRANRPKNPL